MRVNRRLLFDVTRRLEEHERDRPDTRQAAVWRTTGGKRLLGVAPQI